MQIDDLAVANFLDVWGQDKLAADIGDLITCNEAEVIADLFCALGAHEMAERWITRHAQGDTEEDDLHYQGEKSETEEVEVPA